MFLLIVRLIFEVDRKFKNVHKRGKFVDLEKCHENEKRALDQEKFVWHRS